MPGIPMPLDTVPLIGQAQPLGAASLGVEPDREMFARLAPQQPIEPMQASFSPDQFGPASQADFRASLAPAAQPSPELIEPGPQAAVPAMVDPAVQAAQLKQGLPAVAPTVPGEGVALPATPVERVGQRAEEAAQLQADTASKNADAMQLYADRSAEIVEREQATRRDVESRVAEIDSEIDADRQELRQATRTAAEGGKPGAGFLVGAAMQALKVMLTQEQPNMQLLQGMITADAEKKSRAVAGAKQRLGQSKAAKDDLIGQDRERSYWTQLQISESWDQLGRELQADAAKETDLAAKQQLETAGATAMANAEQSRVQSQQLALTRAVSYEQSLADLEYKRGQTAKLGADTAQSRAKAEKLARRGGGKSSTGFEVVTEKQLRGLKPAVQKKIQALGVRDIRGDFLTNPDQTFVTANTPKEAQDIRDGMGSVQDVNDQLNKLLSLREKHGMEWSLLNSAARQEMEGAAAKLEMVMNKAMKLGALDAGSLEVIQRMTGSGNPAGWYDKSATWSALQHGIEGGVNRQLRAHSSFKGTFKLPKRQTIDRTLKQIETTIDRPVDPVSGKIVPTATRMKALEEARQKQSGDVGLRLATDLSAEKTTARVNREHKKIMRQLEGLKKKARAAGDQKRVQTLDKSMKEQMKFAKQAGEWASKQERKIKQGEIQSEKERKKEAGRTKYFEQASLRPTPGKI